MSSKLARRERRALQKKIQNLERENAAKAHPNKVMVAQSVQSVQYGYSGPVPDPQMMAEYKAIDPEYPQRLLAMSERQASHRQGQEHFALRARVGLSALGALFGFLLGGFGLWIAWQIVLANHPVAGTIVGTIDLVALVGLFLGGKRAEAKRMEG